MKIKKTSEKERIKTKYLDLTKEGDSTLLYPNCQSVIEKQVGGGTWYPFKS